MSDLIWFPIRADFADQILWSYSGGIVEIEVGAACVSEKVAHSLRDKIQHALDQRFVRDISLWLTEDEAMCLAIASENCQLSGLPKAQRDRIEHWMSVWRDRNKDELGCFELAQLKHALLIEGDQG